MILVWFSNVTSLTTLPQIAAAHESRMQALAEEQQQEMDRIKEMIRKKVQLQEAQSLATKYTEGAEGVGEGGSGDDSVLERAKKTLSRVEGKK